MKEAEKRKNPQGLNNQSLADFKVSEMRFELTQPNGHYPLKVACLPIPPPGHMLTTFRLEAAAGS